MAASEQRNRGGMRLLGRDTVVYGATNILSKFLNWLLAPFYIRVLADAAEYGIVTNLYAWVSVILVVLTLGLETGLFRFISTSGTPRRIFATCLKISAIAVALFWIVAFANIGAIAAALDYARTPEYVAIFVAIVGMDALLSIPFAYLRSQQRAFRFSFYKILFILLNIGFNLFFLLLCPILQDIAPVSWFYRPGHEVWYIFVSNLLATAVQMLCMLPVIRLGWSGFEKSLVPKLFHYCWPLILLGLAGSFNKMAGQILIPHLFADRTYAMSQLGIYGGCLKIAVVMVMFMQAFRFAYDPFVFARMKSQDGPTAYRVAMNFFVLFTCLIFLGVMYWIDLFKYVVRPEYYEGLVVVPIVMAGEIAFGIYYNLSIWYKLSDRTYFGALFSLIGLVVTVAIILLFTPRYGYVAAAWASFVCNLIMLLLSFLLGRRFYPIPYDTLKVALLLLLTYALYRLGMLIAPEPIALRLTLRTLLLLGFSLGGLYIIDRPLFHSLTVKALGRHSGSNTQHL